MNGGQKNWYVYLAQCGDGSFYCGITDNLIRRFQAHNGLVKGGAKYTASRRPVLLVCWLTAENKSSALKLELCIKKLPRHKKIPFFGQYAFF